MPGYRRQPSTAFLRAALVAVCLLPAVGSPSPRGAETGETPAARTSEDGRYVVALRSRRYPLPVNELHEWTVLVRDRGRRPVLGARLEIGGGMPGHGHGFPTEPRVTRELGNGWYLVEGVKFSMPGAWQFEVSVDDGTASDVVRFDVSVAAWSESEVERLRSLWIERLGPPPPDPSNAWADDPAARRLGHRLFFDAGLSRDGSVSCATCHDPTRAFSDGRERSRGLGETRRNAPTLVGAAWSPWQYWDGRRDSLWAQALTPLEAAEEMGATRLSVLHHIADDPALRRPWERAFGPLPSLDDRRRFPRSAGPRGDATERERWATMAPADRAAVDRAFAKVGKALAAYQRVLRPGASRFDRYVAAILGRERGVDPASLLDADERAGLELLLTDRVHCLRCHNGPRFTNDGFHNVGRVPGTDPTDRGRAGAIDAVLNDPFNCLGDHSDAPEEACGELTFIQRHDATLAGAYKVPTLRNVARTAPYMHAGQLATLGEVLEHYNLPGSGGPGHQEIEPLGLDDRQLARLEAFLRALDAPVDADPRWLRPPTDEGRD